MINICFLLYWDIIILLFMKTFALTVNKVLRSLLRLLTNSWHGLINHSENMLWVFFTNLLIIFLNNVEQ